MMQKEEIERIATLLAAFEGQYGVIPYRSYNEAKRDYDLKLAPSFTGGAMLSAVLVRRAEIVEDGGESMQKNLAFIDMLLERYKDEGLELYLSLHWMRTLLMEWGH
jgi:hypothetical protein